MNVLVGAGVIRTRVLAVGLFAEDAIVIDEGEERHGTAEIRAWQTSAASKYTYTTEITNAEALAHDHYLVTGRLTGNFPGGTADLKWHFSIAGQHITRLIIAHSCTGNQRE